ncbi:MAG: hypothetical protein ACLR8Y_06150 [Alistipes indistinctus]
MPCASGAAIHVFVMEDRDAAGYLYNDLSPFLDEERLLFFPTAYKRSIQFGQEDPSGIVQRHRCPQCGKELYGRLPGDLYLPRGAGREGGGHATPAGEHSHDPCGRYAVDFDDRGDSRR